VSWRWRRTASLGRIGPPLATIRTMRTRIDDSSWVDVHGTLGTILMLAERSRNDPALQYATRDQAAIERELAAVPGREAWRPFEIEVDRVPRHFSDKIGLATGSRFTISETSVSTCTSSSRTAQRFPSSPSPTSRDTKTSRSTKRRSPRCRSHEARATPPAPNPGRSGFPFGLGGGRSRSSLKVAARATQGQCGLHELADRATGRLLGLLKWRRAA